MLVLLLLVEASLTLRVAEAKANLGDVGIVVRCVAVDESGVMGSTELLGAARVRDARAACDVEVDEPVV